MPPLPKLSGRKVVRVFERFGWSIARQKGSHIILVKENHIATLSVPDHKEVAKGTLLDKGTNPEELFNSNMYTRP
ncbi:MAG: type II toxin-antitoxin system HicA family toxin [Candidatus Thiosymbion ectosymbiont of Robbea hypermnestra]|nr:type II toxin-antitoxin system HicA family toxin [Candidatus Thiosymbion ectosymbiont of Robbea hypermnestra]